jgi:hypothetical protein
VGVFLAGGTAAAAAAHQVKVAAGIQVQLFDSNNLIKGLAARTVHLCAGAHMQAAQHVASVCLPSAGTSLMLLAETDASEQLQSHRVL